MRARNDCHFRLPAYEKFLGQAFHAIPGETGTYISTSCIRCFADRFTLHLFDLFFYFCFIMKQQFRIIMIV